MWSRGWSVGGRLLVCIRGLEVGSDWVERTRIYLRSCASSSLVSHVLASDRTFLALLFIGNNASGTHTSISSSISW